MSSSLAGLIETMRVYLNVKKFITAPAPRHRKTNLIRYSFIAGLVVAVSRINFERSENASRAPAAPGDVVSLK
jgi:hypothetical protein